MTEPAWGVDSEYGRLLDVLLCPSDNFHWLPASAISRATLDSGLTFSPEDAKRQHAEMVWVYQEDGVACTCSSPTPTSRTRCSRATRASTSRRARS